MPRWRSTSVPTRAGPRSCPSSGPTFKWGGDNSDAFYNFAPVAPDLEYRVHGKRGDAVYLSVCVYGGPDDGRWSTRIVSNLNDRDIDFDADGSFEIVVSRERPAGARNWLALADDANAMVTRDYHVDPVHGAPTVYDDRSDPGRSAPPPPLSDAEVAGRLRSVTNFLRELLAITPLPDPADARTPSPTCGPCPTRRTAGPPRTRTTRWDRSTSPTTSSS